jgi:hypothetical protein
VLIRSIWDSPILKSAIQAYASFGFRRSISCAGFRPKAEQGVGSKCMTTFVAAVPHTGLQGRLAQPSNCDIRLLLVQYDRTLPLHSLP